MLVALVLLLASLLRLPTVEGADQTDIYVDPRVGTTNSSCWTSGEQLPCRTLDLALQGAVQVSNEDSVAVHLLSGETYTITSSYDFVRRNGFELSLWERGQGIAELSAVTVSCSGSVRAGLGFFNSTNITIENVKFTECGAERISTSRNQNSKNERFLEFQVTLYFLLCSDVSMENVTIENSNGTGLVLYGTVGQNTFKSCFFTGNTPKNSKSGGGGGVDVELLFCIPGNSECFDNNYIPLINFSSNSNYIFEDCYFSDNVAKTDDFVGDAFVLPELSYNMGLGRGGGLSMLLKGNATNVSVLITGCHFVSNTAVWGAGLELLFEDYSRDNLVKVISSEFIGNKCKYDVFSYRGTGGGGARIQFAGITKQVKHNKVMIEDTSFRDNIAYFGGGVSFFTTREVGVLNSTNSIVIVNSNFTNNTARLGSGIDMALWHEITEGVAVKPMLTNCRFEANTVIYTDRVGAPVGIGTVYTDSVDILFQGSLHIHDNVGSGLASLNAGLEFMFETTANFSGNIGTNGGAVALFSYAYIRVYNNTTLSFVNNTAHFKGGAIYWESIGDHELISSRACFIRYSDVSISPYDWQTHFVFKQNSVGLSGKAIYATTLLTCLWSDLQYGSLSSVSEQYNEVFCWNNHSHIWDYENGCSSSIATSGAYFVNVTQGDPYYMETIPGAVDPLPVVIRDDRNATIPKTAQIFSVIIKGHSSYVSGLDFELLPDANQKELTVTLSTLQPRVLTTEVFVKFADCPPGYHLNLTDIYGKQCNTCMKCDFAKYPYVLTNGYLKSKIQRGHWIGYNTNNKTYPHSIVSGQCFECASDFNKNRGEYLSLPNNPDDLDQHLCQLFHRTGLLCSTCMDGYGPSVNSKFYECVDCGNGTASAERYSWALYILSELAPTTILLVVVIMFNVSVTSGPGNAFIFFAQIITGTFGVDGEGTIDYQAVTSAANPIKQVYGSLYDIWNLNFFDFIPAFRFCLSRDLNSLHMRTLEYITAAYPLVLLAFILLATALHERQFRLIVWMMKPLHRLLARFRRRWNFKRSLVDAVGTFIVLSFSKFAVISSYMLYPGILYNHEGGVAETVCFIHGEYRYFSLEYAPYLIFASLIFSIICILMPLILFLYSVKPFYSCLEKFKLKFLLPGPKFQLFLNVFHNCFKDGTDGTHDLRFFASLYFLLRVLIVSVNFAAPFWAAQYLMQQIICTVGILLFGALQPYKRTVYNLLDAFVFSLLAIINVISLYNRYLVAVNNSPSPLTYWLQIVLIFIPLVYMSCYLVFYFCRANKNTLKWIFWRVCCCGRRKKPSWTILSSGQLEQSFGSFMDSMVAAGEYRDTINYYGPPETEEQERDVIPTDHRHTSICLVESHRDTEPVENEQSNNTTQTFSHLSFDPAASPSYGTVTSQNT